MTNSTTLMVSSLLVTALAAVTPFVSTPMKAEFSSLHMPAAAGGNTGAGVPLEIVKASNVRPLTFVKVGDNYRAYVVLRNTNTGNDKGDDPKLIDNVVVDVKLQSASGAEWTPRPKVTPQCVAIKPGDSTVVLIEINLVASQSMLLPATGIAQFRLSSAPCRAPDAALSEQEVLAAKPIRQEEIRIPHAGVLMGTVFVGSLFTSLLIVIIAVVALLHKKVGLTNRMGSPSWSFDKSWGSNVTLGSALLIALLGLAIFPDRPIMMSKQSYSLLQILFGGVLSLGPLAYNLITRDTEVSHNGLPTVTAQGYVFTFLIAGCLVLWAAIGQIMTLCVLIEEFSHGGILDAPTAVAMQGLLGLLLCLLFAYGVRTLYLSPTHFSADTNTVATKDPSPQPASVGTTLPIRIRDWSLL